MKTSSTVLFLLRRLDCNDGVASYCETIITGLAARGDRVVMVSGPVTELYGSSPRRQAIAETVLDWIVLEKMPSKLPSVALLRRILSVMGKYDVDIISPQGLSLLPLASCLGLISRRKIVANYHPSGGGTSAKSIETRYSTKTKLGYRALLTVCRPTRLIAISQEIVDFYHDDCGISRKRIKHISNGVDLQKFRPPTEMERSARRESMAIGANTLVCVLTGRLNFVKGHDVVVDAIHILRYKMPALKVICLFVGGGDQEQQIKEYALKDEADAAAFRFLGFVPGDDALRNVYWASDVALLPSRFEGFALVIAEAMGCGCVPIRTRSGGWRDQIVDGSNGFLIPFNDPQALADRILDLSNSDRRFKMRNNAIMFANVHLGQERMVEATSMLYRSL